ncbi:hypothetical protein PMAYCL1PPCAC_31098, partial [Pristionchus mayeri]
TTSSISECKRRRPNRKRSSLDYKALHEFGVRRIVEQPAQKGRSVAMHEEDRQKEEEKATSPSLPIQFAKDSEAIADNNHVEDEEEAEYDRGNSPPIVPPIQEYQGSSGKRRSVRFTISHGNAESDTALGEEIDAGSDSGVSLSSSSILPAEVAGEGSILEASDVHVSDDDKENVEDDEQPSQETLQFADEKEETLEASHNEKGEEAGRGNENSPVCVHQEVAKSSISCF